MQVTDAIAGRRALMRPFAVFFLVLSSGLVSPHAYAAIDCETKYANSGAYPADPQCPLNAASADFGGMGGYACGDTSVIAAYCSGPTTGTTSEPSSPDGTATADGDGTDGADDQSGGADGSGDSAGSDDSGSSGDASDPTGADNSAGSGGCGDGGATAGCGSSTSGADPVKLNTGQFHLVAHDLRVSDTIALDLARVYRSSAYDSSGRPMAGAFGIGTTVNYDSYLTVSAADSNNLRQLIQLYLPSGIRISFTLRAGTTSTWDDLTSPGKYFRATITGSGTKLLTLRDGRTMQFTMLGGLYRLTRLQDRNGNTVTMARDSKTGALTKLTSPNSRSLTFTSVIGTRGTPLISGVTDGLNRHVSYQYDGLDRLTQVTDAAGGLWEYSWDDKSRLVGVTDPEGNQQVINTYDDNDRVVSQRLADGSTFAMAYTAAGGKITQTEVTDRRASIRRVEFDANGRVQRNTYPAGHDIAQVQTYGYDTTGRMTSATVGDRQYVFVYDANGNRVTDADQYGTLVTRIFDAYSRLLTKASAGDPQRGVSTVYAYDSKGNLLSATDRLGNRTVFTNDSQGRRLTVTDALKGLTKYVWTGADLTSVTDPLNRTTQFTTDAVGRVTAVQDPQGNRTQRTLDALGRTVDITDALNGVTRFTWDRNGHLLSRSDPKGVTTRYTYNSIGRPQTKTDPLGNSERYAWNSAGQIAAVTDRKGQVTTYIYDAAGRTVRTDFRTAAAAPPVRSWVYAWDNKTGNLSGTQDFFPTDDGRNQKEVDTVFYYDAVTGKLIRTFDSPTIQGIWTYRYAPDTRDVAGIDMDRATVDYSRDAEHRVTQIQYQVNDEDVRTFGYSYDALGRRSQETFANGITAIYAWDAASQLTGITYKRADGGFLGDLTYGYDAAGRRIKAGGSLSKVSLPQSVNDAQYNAANQLTRWAGKTFAYDLNGNVVSDAINQYNWNEQGLLSQISGGVMASFTYDMFGRRRDRTVNGHRMQTTWIGGEMNFMVPDGDWSQRIRVFSPYPTSDVDELTFRRIGDDSSQDRYVLRDANNNVIALTDAQQQSQTVYSYEPYGATMQTGLADPNTQQYTGRENDGTGLYYYRSRYYNPATARFISEDPIGWASGQTNAYAYVNGNPVQFTDPFGESKLMPITGGPRGGFIVHPFKPNVNYYDSNGDLSAQYHGGHSHDGMTPHGHNAGPGFDRNDGLELCPIP
ncbi:RHS repeat-associated core domain-containing protein [Paraburkholderia phenoliruptrix]|uniref:YD repeat-containing protein n=2 Tax=Paraburkholderia phenoliruptrix TaxID=252970 RepID=K0DXI6_9BURK|nr:RHS repeat-associated core domain-containing protein [Paraburkholderia phenoliruptrix]AFT88738.1 YD repeat-containing protein [Paraburkholderia phenoliruptrix BR3459a]CAB4047685.1 hypothetical protein LMG9964_01318 [Paraburkholderia phenoliruptrix]